MGQTIVFRGLPRNWLLSWIRGIPARPAGYNRIMSEKQMLTVALATVPTFLVVLVGILLNNSRLSDLRSYIDVRFSAMDQRFSDMEKVNEARTNLILGKIEDVDTRLSRLEGRFAR